MLVPATSQHHRIHPLHLDLVRPGFRWREIDLTYGGLRLPVTMVMVHSLKHASDWYLAEERP